MDGPDIRANLEVVRERIDKACARVGRASYGVTLVAITKLAGAESIRECHRLGLRHFGENRVQDAQSKIKTLEDLEPRPAWYFVGHLQTNKVKLALELFDVIQSVDSLRLARALDARAAHQIPVLLEINFTTLPGRTGFSPETLLSQYETISELPHLTVKGLMTVAPVGPDAGAARPCFKKLRLLADALHLEHLSMGMTDDFEIAIEEGATMVRLGRAIFGQ